MISGKFDIFYMKSKPEVSVSKRKCFENSFDSHICDAWFYWDIAIFLKTHHNFEKQIFRVLESYYRAESIRRQKHEEAQFQVKGI